MNTFPATNDLKTIIGLLNAINIHLNDGQVKTESAEMMMRMTIFNIQVVGR